MKLNTSIILESILELKDKFSKSDSFLTSEEILKLNNKKGFFNLKTIWNTHDFERDKDKLLFGFKSGVYFTNSSIKILKDEWVGETPTSKKFLFELPTTGNSFNNGNEGRFHSHLCHEDNIYKYESRGSINYMIYYLKLFKPNKLVIGDLHVPYSHKIEEICLDKKDNLIGHNSNKSGWTLIYLQSQEEINYFKKLEELVVEKNQNRNKQLSKLKKKNKLNLKNSKSKVLSELDKDGNGIIDVIEGSDDFMTLFKKHQKKVIEFDKTYINHFVKVSNYLKTKRENIQDIFSSIKDTTDQSQLEEHIGLLKNQIHTYELLLLHSLSMLTSLVEEDLITVNEIYESFDKLNMFNSNWENEVSQQLNDIGDGLNNLMYSINDMERSMVNGLNELNYTTQEGFHDLNKSVTRELSSINSSVKFNNLLTGINTYQMYKINKKTKSLN